MQGDKINFVHIISVIRREFERVRKDELVKSNLSKLDYLEGVVIGTLKLIRSFYEEDLNRYGKMK